MLLIRTGDVDQSVEARRRPNGVFARGYGVYGTVVAHISQYIHQLQKLE